MEQRPAETPIGRVRTSDAEWYNFVQRGIRLGFTDSVDDADISRDLNGKLVLDGAMGVLRLKRLPDGSTVGLQRFVYNLVPMSSYFRRLREDSSLLRLGLIVLDEGEKFEIDSKDMESAFNLFRKPTWKNFFVFVRVPCAVRPGGDPNKWVFVVITTVPMCWVGRMDVIQHIARRPVFNLFEVPRASEVSSLGPLPTPSSPQLGLHGWLGFSQFTPSRDTPSFVHRFRVACDQLQLLPHARKRVVRASTAPILGAELDGARGILRRARDTGHSVVFTIFIALGALLLVVVCPAALSGPVRIRSWLSLASILCLQEVCS